MMRRRLRCASITNSVASRNEPRIAASTAEVELAGLDGQHLDLPSEQFDAVLSTWTLCTIPDLGTALVDEAKRLSPDGVALLVNTDNARAIRFYRRNGFVDAGGDVNPTSGKPVLRMEWKP